ncbi:Isoleucine--tRNA ligase [Candidatus Annandia adelgestsuga]|uniref:Isoleucine--tRNA ligase n=1 Tax=Candidatus Annandia adelgestsuga TaxID=1302411 RepID=A0A3Q9CM56_9ENTR|nr:isoleucine--tRNA ligase [Candidatus Annandia adelgestsuga]AZP36252.1 Isoleucine--tRNA ligase [Candidatus Annandia adelgestsuga]
MINYKNTLNLPKTSFPMRGNLSKKEPEILQYWYDNNLYKIIRKNKINKKKFILHDGPPYANGKIHMGHVINKILKDIIIKFKGLDGFDAPYIPGWDCHGLPIEQQIEKIFDKSKNISNIKFQNVCRKYAKKQIKQQKNDFIRLGILGDWDNYYCTMNSYVEANTIRILGNIIKKNSIYQGIKPVYWCLNCNSTLAESEIEYIDKISTSVYVLFKLLKIKKNKILFNINKKNNYIYAVIWTTNPWTLLANSAISVNPKYLYNLIKFNNNCYIIAKELLLNFIKKMEIKKYKIIGEIEGKKLEYLLFQNPIINIKVPIVLNNNIDLKSGTGIVHIAPGHGPEDYIIGNNYNLKIKSILNNYGYYEFNNNKKLNGMYILEINNYVINFLKIKKLIIKKENYKHSYPHCWRHKTPIIFRTTNQWFIKIKKNKKIKNIIKKINKVNWIPEWGKKNIKKMISERPDWCISRQRKWGIPITLFLNKKTKKLHPKTLTLIEKISKLIEIHGIKIWWYLNKKILLGKSYKKYIKIKDTLDVWFDSGCTHLTVIKNKFNYSNIIDMYLEGIDQYRGWFMSSLIISFIIKKKSPYRNVLSHGFVVDKKGEKMSKSIGNIINYKFLIKKFGVDIIRLWISSVDYTKNINISQENLNNTVDIYRKIRNTIRFLLSNLYDFKLKNIINYKNMLHIDRWAVSYTKKIQKSIIKNYKLYNFSSVIKHIMNFCSIKMSSFYLDIIKDRQYTINKNNIARLSCQTALYYIIESLVRWITPIMSFTAHEVWNYIPGKRSKYIFTEEWFENNKFELNNKEFLNNKYWNKIIKIRNKVNKCIEKIRDKNNIKNSLELDLKIYTNKKNLNFLKILGKELKFIFLTSDANVFYKKNITEKEEIKIILTKFKGIKCLRCWHYFKKNNKNFKYYNLCNRCITNVYGEGEIRKFV